MATANEMNALQLGKNKNRTISLFFFDLFGLNSFSRDYRSHKWMYYAIHIHTYIYIFSCLDLVNAIGHDPMAALWYYSRFAISERQSPYRAIVSVRVHTSKYAHKFSCNCWTVCKYITFIIIIHFHYAALPSAIMHRTSGQIQTNELDFICLIWLWWCGRRTWMAWHTDSEQPVPETKRCTRYIARMVYAICSTNDIIGASCEYGVSTAISYITIFAVQRH